MSAASPRIPSAKEIFTVALRLEQTARRNEYLSDVCGGDAALRSNVDRLLAAHQETGCSPLDGIADAFGPVDTLVGPAASAPLVDVSTHPVIGPYKLLEQIGEGGMGVVYLATQQQPIRRTVALKIIKPGMDSRQVVARFEAERQALALMNHPHIARVLDAGATEAGLPYFVMELVKGIPLTEFCDQHQFDLRGRLELFLKVCQAVQHAHQKGVIHRDLKPSNILVELEDVKAIPKVIDFGVAKATQQPLTERTLHTGFAQMIGTPLYMSPEQAQLNSLDVDTRSDVYSLGVVLYELLTGATPFDVDTLQRAGFDEMRRMIREDEPLRPSFRVSTLEHKRATTASDRRRTDPRQLSLAMRRELDWIVMKALEKDRTRRYESASALAADVQRYLDDEPVQACPPAALYRFRKLARRHRTVLTAAILLALSLLAGTGVSAWQAWEAKQARGDAEQRFIAERDARQAEAEQRKQAQRNLQLAVGAVDDMYYHLASSWLADDSAPSGVQRHFLEKALAFYSQLVQNTEDYELDPARTAEIHGRLSLIHYELEQFVEAAAELQECVTLQQRLHEQSPHDAELRFELATNLYRLGVLENRFGLCDAEDDHYSAALRHFCELAERHPTQAEYQIGIARTLQNRAALRDDQGRYAEAEELARESGAIFTELGRHLAGLGAASQSLTSRAFLAHVLCAQGRLEEAEQVARDALAQCKSRLISSGDDRSFRRSQCTLLEELGSILLAQERDAEAEATFREELEIEVKLLAARTDPFTFLRNNFLNQAPGNDQPGPWNDWIKNVIRLSTALRRQNKLHEAEMLLGRATLVAVFTRFAYEGDYLFAVTLADAYAETALLLADRYPAEARAHAAEAAETWRSLLQDHPETRAYRSNLHVGQTNLAWFAATFPEFDPTEPPDAEPLDGAPAPRPILAPVQRARVQIGAMNQNALEQIVTLRGGESVIDAFLLAELSAAASQLDEARRWLDKGVVWMQANAPADEELLRLREAARAAIEQAEAKSGTVEEADHGASESPTGAATNH